MSVKDQTYTWLQRNVKILLFIIAALIIAVVLLLIFRPSKSIPDSVYTSKIDSLSKEIYILQEMKKINERQIEEKDNRISAMEERDKVLQARYYQASEQLKNLKSNYEKKRADIDKYTSPELKRAFSELTEDE